jgi:hypothetical protein
MSNWRIYTKDLNTIKIKRSIVIIMAWKTNNGYWRMWVKLPNNKRKKVFVHRYKYEQKFGSIPEGWQVHHIDKNKYHNHPENLVAVTEYEHKRIHAGDHTVLAMAILRQEVKLKEMTELAKCKNVKTSNCTEKYIKDVEQNSSTTEKNSKNMEE